MYRLIAAVCVFMLCRTSLADILALQTGSKLDCTVVQQSVSNVTIIFGKGLLTLPRTDISEIQISNKTPAAQDPENLNTSTRISQKTTADRMPEWSKIIAFVAKQRWADDLRQIPATVIDNGIMRNVPYISNRCGKGYEVNIYGDPDSPAGFEIGVPQNLSADARAKQNCIETVASLLKDATDAKLTRTLNTDEDKIVRAGLTIEITPPESSDAYGCWWISVYDENALNAARASQTEVEEISDAPKLITPNPSHIEKENSTAKPANSHSSQDAAKNAEIVKLNEWASEDFTRAKSYYTSSSTHTRSSHVSSSSSSGRVYVRGYYRKDGTYVRPHTRRRSK